MHRLFALLGMAVVQRVARQLRIVRRATDDVVRQEGPARVGTLARHRSKKPLEGVRRVPF